MSTIEQEQQRVTKALTDNSALLSKMEKSFSENLTTVHSNIAELEVMKKPTLFFYMPVDVGLSMCHVK